MTEKRKLKSFGSSPEQRERREKEDRISQLLHDFEVEFQVYKIRKSDEMRGIVRPIETMILDLLEVYREMGLNPSDLLESLK
jgi:hypothetical protein